MNVSSGDTPVSEKRLRSCSNTLGSMSRRASCSSEDTAVPVDVTSGGDVSVSGSASIAGQSTGSAQDFCRPGGSIGASPSSSLLTTLELVEQTSGQGERSGLSDKEEEGPEWRSLRSDSSEAWELMSTMNVESGVALSCFTSHNGM